MIGSSRKASGLAAALALTCVISACGSSSSKSTSSSTSGASNASGTQSTAASGVAGKTIELINGDSSDPYMLSLAASVKKAGAAAGAKVVVQAPSTFDPTQQESLMEDAVAKKVSAIILSADGYQQLLPSLESAHSAGIPVIVVDEGEGDMDNTPLALSFITGDNSDLGHAAGEELAKLIPAGSTVLPLNSTPGLQSNLERVTGFTSGLKAAQPSDKVLSQQFTHDDPTQAQSITTDVLKANKKVTAVYGVDDADGSGAGTAIEALGLKGKVKLVAIDAEPQEMALLKKGVIQAVVAQKPTIVGALGFQYAVDAITGNKNKIVRSVNPGSFTITQQNMNTPKARAAVYGATS